MVTSNNLSAQIWSNRVCETTRVSRARTQVSSNDYHEGDIEIITVHLLDKAISLRFVFSWIAAKEDIILS